MESKEFDKNEESVRVMRNGKKSYKFQSKGILKKGLNDSGLGDSFVVS